MDAQAQRRKLIAKIKIGQQQLGLDDATYRALLLRVSGKNSCTKLDMRGLEAGCWPNWKNRVLRRRLRAASGRAAVHQPGCDVEKGRRAAGGIGLPLELCTGMARGCLRLTAWSG